MKRRDSRSHSFPRIAALLGRHRRRNRFISDMVIFGAYALLTTAGLLAAKAFLGVNTPAAIVWGLPGGAALLLAAIRTLRTDVSPRRVFRDADETYGYRHLLPTAYELWEKEEQQKQEQDEQPVPPVSAIVVARGQEQANYLRPETVYPLRLPRRLYLLPLSVLACLAVLIAAESVGPSDRNNPWAGYVEEFRNRSADIARRAETLGDEEGARLARQLDALSDTLENRPNEKEIERRLQELLPELEDHMRSLSASDLLDDNPQSAQADEGSASESASLRSRRVEDGPGNGIDLGAPGSGRPGEAGSGEGSGGEDGSAGSGGPGAAGGQDAGGGPEAGNESEADSGNDDDPAARPGGGGDEGQSGSSAPRSARAPDEALNDELRSAREDLEELAEQLRRQGALSSRADGDPDDAMQGSRDTQEGPPPGAENRAASRPDGDGGGSGEGPQDGGSAVRGNTNSPGIGNAPDLAEAPAPRLDGVIRRMSELPSGGDRSSFTELFTRETPGRPAESLAERAVRPEFRREVESAVGRSSVPRELQGYVRDYFLRIARASEPGASEQGE